MTLNSLSTKIAEYLAGQTGQSKEVLTYGLEIIIGAILKGLILTVISYLLGIFTPTITVIIFAAVLRIVSGGAHCSSYRRCLISGLIVFISLGFMNTIFYVTSNKAFNLLLTIGFLFTLVVIMLWVPGPSDNRRIIEKERRLRFKCFSLLITIASYVVIIWAYHNNLRLIAQSGLTGLLWQTFSVTPAGYVFLTVLDSVLNKLKI